MSEVSASEAVSVLEASVLEASHTAHSVLMMPSMNVKAVTMRTLVLMLPPVYSSSNLIPPARTLQGIPSHVLARSGLTNSSSK